MTFVEKGVRFGPSMPANMPANRPYAARSAVARSFSRALDVLIPALDILRERVTEPCPPAFCEARVCTDFLLSLSDEDVSRCEEEGLASRLPFLKGAPSGLLALGEGVSEIVAMPIALDAESAANVAQGPALGASTRSVKERKRKQLDALLSAIAPMAFSASRIVDVGAGSGHLSRFAATMFDRDVLGLDRDEARVFVASTLAEGSRARFVVHDALAEPLAFLPGDLAIGLHACGALGDKIIVEAQKARADVVLVSCCLQKIEGEERLPLSRLGAEKQIILPRDVLGLSNLTPRLVGVEASLGEMLEARRVRFALGRLLRGRGLVLPAGEEMRGINRRKAHAGLAALSRLVCEKRGLSTPSAAEVAEHDEKSRVEYGRIRRFSLPRSMLARALEVVVVLDRAVALEERGYAVDVRVVFDPEVTPRNLGIFGRVCPGQST